MRFRDVLMTAATAGGGRDPDLAAWMAAVFTNGGTVSAGRAAIVGQFIADEKASGNWTLTDDYLGLWAENTAQSLVSLKQRRVALAVGSPTFTANAGYTFDGATNYLDTGFIANVHALAMQATNARIAVYERTNVLANTTAIGVNATSNRMLVVRPRPTSGTLSGYGLSTAGTFTLSSADSRGLSVVGRNGPNVTDTYAYKNGAGLTRTGDPSAVGATLPNVSIYVGAWNATGTPNTFRASAIGFGCWGASLSPAQELAQYNAVQAWATAVGAAV